jgi:hypothetical protein
MSLRFIPFFAKIEYTQLRLCNVLNITKSASKHLQLDIVRIEIMDPLL